LGVPCHASLDDLFARDKPDALIIATPNDVHVPQALQALAQGLPVLLEKPVSTTVAQGQLLLDAVQATGARVLVGHHRAHSPIMAKAREVVQSGRLGRLVAVQGSATFYKPERYFADGPWRAQPGGGPILINMIHEVHNLRMLCGEIAAVQAFASHAVRGFAVEDTAVINLRFDSGVLGSFVLSDTAASARSWEQTSQENKAYPSYGDEDCYVLSGTLGTLEVPTMRTKTYADAQQASWWLPFEVGAVDLVREDPLKRQLDHFVQVIVGQAQPLVSVRDGLQNLRVIEAIVQAVRTGQAVQI
jgi:predicted dehydrogenase